MSTKQVINLLADHDPVYREAKADVEIAVGSLVKVSATGVTLSTEAAAAYSVADTNPCNGGTIDDNYAAGDLLRYGNYSEGDEVLLLLADGQNVAEGDALAGGAQGQVVAGSGVGIALESVDNSVGGAAARIAVRLTRGDYTA